jgi:hypothetical protein
MEAERGAYPGLSDTRSSQAHATAQVAGDAPTAPPAGAPGKRAQAGLNGPAITASTLSTRPARRWLSTAKVDRAGLPGIVEYVRSQPMTALLIAAGVGLGIGLLLTLGRK